MTLYGHRTDIEHVQRLFTSLSLQLVAMMNHDAPRGAGVSWRTSYAHGWVLRVLARLREARVVDVTEAVAEAPGTAVMLRDRKAVVQQFFDDYHSGVKLRASYRNRSVRSGEGLSAGDAAGRRANLGQTPVAARRRALEG